MRKSKYLIPLVLLAVVGILLWRSGIAHALTWESLVHHQAELTSWVDAHRFLAGAAYFGLYTTLVAFSIPESAIVTIAGGLLFGTLIGGTLALLGSTLGAVIIFLIARTAFAKTVSRRARPLIRRIRPGIRRDGFSYLLALRLVPAFPFWLINLGAGAAGMRLAPYAAATLLGIIPGTFIFASIGDGVGSVLAAGGRPDLTVIFCPRILGPLIGLAALSLSPVILRHFRQPKRERG